MDDKNRKDYLTQIYHEKFYKLSDKFKNLGFIKPTENQGGNVDIALTEKNEKFNAAAEDVQKALVNDPEEKIITMSDKHFYNYFKSALESNRKDMIKKETKHLRAKITDTGKLPMGFEGFEKGKTLKKKDIEQLEEIQESQGLPTVKYSLITEGEIVEMPGTFENNKGETIDGDEKIEDDVAMSQFNEEEEKKEKLNLLAYGLKILDYACQKIIKEKILREKQTEMPFTWSQWSKEKKESKETLKSRYFRCEEKLREIVFPSKEQIA